MKIRPKIQLAFLLIGLIPMVGFAWFSLDRATSILKSRIIDQLDSVASVQKQRIEMLMDQNLERLKLVSSRTQLRINLSKYRQDGHESYREDILRILRDAQSSIPAFRRLSVLDLQGRVIVSTDPQLTGLDLSGQSFVRRGLKFNQTDTFSLDEREGLLSILSGPLILQGETIGLMMIETSAQGFIAITQSYEGLGQTGETILFKRLDDATLEYLTPLRFDPQAALRIVKANGDATDLLHQALEPTERILLQALDYRGVPVLAVTRHVTLTEDLPIRTVPNTAARDTIPERHDLGLAVKIDQKEVFAPVHLLRRLTYLILGATFLAVLIVSFLLSNSITRPIRGLAQIATSIRDGNLSPHIQTHGDDETAELAANLLRMAEGLTEANRTLEQKVAERTQEFEVIRERYSLAVRGSTDGLWDWNVLTNEVSYSDRFKELLGYPPDGFENVFASFETRLHPEDRERILAAVQAHLEKRVPYDVEYRLRCRNGSYRWFRARGLAVWNEAGQATRMAGSISDVTNQKQAEDELRRSNEELGRFASVASHDLKEPLRMVTSYLQLLTQRHLDKLPAEAREFVQIAMDGAERMRRLIEDLLHYARIGAQRPPLKPTETDAVFGKALANLERSINERSAEITAGALPVVLGDETQLIQLFQNLLGNALKFCPKDRTPRIQVTASRQDQDWLFQVRDNGVGIEAANLKRVFQIFQRACGRDEYEGTGIGLAVCQKIVEQHGGRIWVESEPGLGSTFFFTLRGTV